MGATTLKAASSTAIRGFTRTRTAGARVLLIMVGFAFAGSLAYELAILSYTPKERPLQFHSSISLPWDALIAGWTIFTLLLGLAFVFHRRLHEFLRRFSLVRRLWKNLLLLGIATLVAIGLVELGLRIVNPLGISTFPETLRFWDVMMIPDPELRYRLRPDTTITFHGVFFETNSEGMRDDPPLPAPPGRRILAFGDSVALGANVPRGDTALHLLEEMLGGRETVDVVNTAVSSYNTVQQSRLLSRIGGRYAPDLVLLLYVENDAETEHLLPFYPPEYWHQAVYLPRTMAQYSYLRHPLRLGMNALGADPVRKPVPHNQRGWSLSRQALMEMNEWCNERGVPFLVVFYSMLDPLTGHDYFRLLKDAGDELGFTVLYSARYWMERSLSDIRRSAVDSHLNALGHQVLAEGLNKELRQRYPFLVDPARTSP